MNHDVRNTPAISLASVVRVSQLGNDLRQERLVIPSDLVRSPVQVGQELVALVVRFARHRVAAFEAAQDEVFERELREAAFRGELAAFEGLAKVLDRLSHVSLLVSFQRKSPYFMLNP